MNIYGNGDVILISITNIFIIFTGLKESAILTFPSVPDIPNYGCCSCTCLTQTPPYIILPFGSVGGWAVVPVFKGFSCMGRSEARFSGKNTTQKNEGGDCSTNGIVA